MRINVLNVTSGDNSPLIIEFRDVNENTVDISSFSKIEFTVKDKRNRELIYKSLANLGLVYDTDGTDGRVRILILPEDTHSLDGNYNYDIQITRDVGGTDVVSTLANSFFVVRKDINER